MSAVLLLLAAISTPTADCPYPIDTVQSQIERKGGHVFSLDDVPSANGDQVLVYEQAGKVKVGVAFHGCMVEPPVEITDSRSNSPPA